MQNQDSAPSPTGKTSPLPRAVVILSGGLDSAYALCQAQLESEVRFALTFDYGQRAAESEIRQASRIAQAAGVSHRVLTFKAFANAPDHPLLDTHTPLPALHSNELDDQSVTLPSAKAVWVPNRNGIFINLAAGLAEAEGVKYLYVGFNVEEATTFPDNSAAFVAAANAALSYSTANGVEVKSPPIAMTKTDIVRELAKTHFDFRQLWSCYENGPTMCGRCESCLRLKRALAANSLSMDTLFLK